MLTTTLFPELHPVQTNPAKKTRKQWGFLSKWDIFPWRKNITAVASLKLSWRANGYRGEVPRTVRNNCQNGQWHPASYSLAYVGGLVFLSGPPKSSDCCPKAIAVYCRLYVPLLNRFGNPQSLTVLLLSVILGQDPCCSRENPSQQGTVMLTFCWLDASSSCHVTLRRFIPQTVRNSSQFCGLFGNQGDFSPRLFSLHDGSKNVWQSFQYFFLFLLTLIRTNNC